MNNSMPDACRSFFESNHAHSKSKESFLAAIFVFKSIKKLGSSVRNKKIILLTFLFFSLFFLLISTSTIAAPQMSSELTEALEYHRAGKFKEAIEVYTEYLEKNPKSAEAYNWRGMAYDDLNELDKALADLNKAIELSPNYADAYNNRGEVYRKQNKLNQAIADYRKAIDLDKNFPEAHYNLALIYETQKKHDLALKEYSNYLLLRPSAVDKQQVSEKIESLKKMGATAPPPAQQPSPGATPERKAPERKAGERPMTKGERPGHPKPAMPAVQPMPEPTIPGVPSLPVPTELLTSLGIVSNIISIIFYIFMAVMLYMIANKTATELPWLAFIPIANLYLMVKIAGKPTWWLALFFAPILAIPIGLLASIDPTGGIITAILIGITLLVAAGAWLMLSLGIATARGKSTIWGILLFLPCTNLIALGYLGLSE